MLILEIRKATKTRHGEVRSMLEGLKTSRGRASRESRRQAAATINGRHSAVKAMLAQFGREQVAQRHHRLTLATAQHEQAASFMRDLTSTVATLRDSLSKQDSDRAAAVRERLSAYALDRRNGSIAWTRTLSTERATPRSMASHEQPAARPAGPAQSREPAVPAAQHTHGQPVHPPHDQPAHPRGRHASGHTEGAK